MTMDRNKRRKILFLVGGTPRTGLDPSSRFRVFSYLPQLESDGRYLITISASFPAKSFHEGRFFKAHPALAKPLVALGLVLMVLRRLLDLARCPFYDIVFLQRPLFPGRPFPLLELAICALNRNVVFDFDDAIFVDHHKDIRRPFWTCLPLVYDPGNVARILRAARQVIAGNAVLADFARLHNPRVAVVPTPVDCRHYAPASPTTPSVRPVVVGWIGTSGNLRYLYEVAPVLRSLQQRLLFEIHIVCNPADHGAALDGVQYRWIDWSLERERDALRTFDIGIMPLPDLEWERGKCGFKLLQYMACGIPAVASPVGVNVDIIKDGENGFLAADHEAWEARLAALIADADLRRGFARKGRETVERHYSVDVVYPLVVSTLDAAIEGARNGLPA